MFITKRYMALTIACLLAPSIFLNAQDNFGPNTPKTPAKPVPKKTLTPEEKTQKTATSDSSQSQSEKKAKSQKESSTSAKVDGKTVLVESLKGIQFLSSRDKVNVAGVKDLSGIKSDVIICRDPVFQKELNEQFIGKPVTLDVLRSIAEKTMANHRKNNNPNVDVFIPVQDISSGVVQVVVQKDSKPGMARVEGNKWIPATASQSEAKKEHPSVKVAEKETPAALEKAPSATTQASAAKESSQKVLLPSLKGIVFVPSQNKVISSGVKLTGVNAKEVAVCQNEKFQKELAAAYLNKPASLATLNEIAQKTVALFREQDRPVVDVYVPEQDITSGTVQFVAQEAKVGKVKVEGNKWFSDESIESQIRANPGDVIRGKRLLSDLNWINQNPFRQADLVYSRGAEVGQTDLNVRVQDRFPVRFFAGYETTGNSLTGDDRWLMGFNWGNVFGLDHMMNYQFSSSGDFWSGPDTTGGRKSDPMFEAHSASYVIPLPWRHRLIMFGSYVESNADLPANTFNLTGKSWQTSLRYAIPFENVGPLSHELQLGYDFKQSNNNLEFGGTQVFNNYTDVSQFVLAYTASVPDALGATSATGTLYYSPGGMSDNNKDSDYQLARNRAYAEYTYGTISMERLTRLPADFTYSIRSTYQMTTGSLIGSEQMGFGGHDTIRGYTEREVNGDSGWIMTHELRTPAISIGEFLNIANATDKLQFLGFWDYGVSEIRHTVSGQAQQTNLSGAGAGVRYTIDPYLSFKFDYGFQLLDSGMSNPDASRGNISVIVSY